MKIIMFSEIFGKAKYKINILHLEICRFLFKMSNFIIGFGLPGKNTAKGHPIYPWLKLDFFRKCKTYSLNEFW